MKQEKEKTITYLSCATKSLSEETLTERNQGENKRIAHGKY